MSTDCRDVTNCDSAPDMVSRGRRLAFNPYLILGLGAGASSAEIKAAYRALAKQIHPDRNFGKRWAEDRIREINRAYRMLSDSESRAKYDAKLALSRAMKQRRKLKGFAAVVGSFIMTASLTTLIGTILLDSHTRQRGVPMPALHTTTETTAVLLPYQVSMLTGAWESTSQASSAASEVVATTILPVDSERLPDHIEALPETQVVIPSADPAPSGAVPSGATDRNFALADEPMVQSSQRARPEAQNGESSFLSGEAPRPPIDVRSPSPVEASGSPSLVSATLATRQHKIADWKQYQNVHSRFSFRYPAEVLKLVGSDIENNDRLLISKDGQAILRIYSVANWPARTVDEYRQSLMATRYIGASFETPVQHDDGFVLSGIAGREAFYEHVGFSCDSRSIHGWLLVYPLAERDFYEEIVAEMRTSYRYDGDTPSPCGEVKARQTLPATRYGSSSTKANKS